MNIILWIVLGGLSGWIASVIMKTNEVQGWLADVLLGIIGAVVGGLVMNMFNEPGVTGFNLYSLVVAILGSIILIAIGRMLSGPPSTGIIGGRGM